MLFHSQCSFESGQVFLWGKKKIAFQMSLKCAWLHIRVIIIRNDRSVFVKTIIIHDVLKEHRSRGIIVE